MKKPTHKPQKKKPIPIGSVRVDYGNKCVVMPYRVSMANYCGKEIIEIHEWCARTFKLNAYFQSGIYPGYMCFVNGADATMFKLRWSR